MRDVLVMEQNLFGAGRVYHFAANRTSITIQIDRRFGRAMIRRAFGNSAWLADGHEAKYEPKPSRRNRAAGESRYQQNPYVLLCP